MEFAPPSSYEATGPNQVRSWDITYLRDAEHAARFYYAFAVVDIYSRYLVHYDMFDAETSQNAVRFLSEAMNEQALHPASLPSFALRQWRCNESR